MSRFFTSLGQFTVRWRFLVVLAWIVVTFLAVQFLPSLADVAKDTTSGFLPANSPSMQAAVMAAPFQDASLAVATIVAARDGGLTQEDNAAFDRVVNQVGAVDKVRAVVDLGVSSDGEARHALVQVAVVAFTGGPEAKSVVDAIRATFPTSGADPGFDIHLTGQLAIQVDTITASGSSQSQTQDFSLLFIVLLLVLAFRALIAPIVTLLPAVFVLILSGPVIAESTKLGVQVSSITQLLLIVLILGAGTDYGVFLVFRVREELRRGLSPHEAVIQSVSRVGESITFSAFTVIAALLTLVLAEFAFYQSLGPALAIGIALMLLAGLTLLPALLAILGRAVFWPTGTRPRSEQRAELWDRDRRRRHPTARPHARRWAGPVHRSRPDAADHGCRRLRRCHGEPGRHGLRGRKRDGPGALSVLQRRPARGPHGVPDLGLGPASGPVDCAGRPRHDSRVQPDRRDRSIRTAFRSPSEQLTQLHTALGPARDLPPVPPANSVAPELYNAYRATGQAISPDGKTIQFSVEFANGNSSSPEVLQSVPAMRADVDAVAQTAGAAASGVFGQVAFAYDISHISGSDLVRIIPIVAVLIAILLAIVLRSLVAPLYFVASIVLSYLAALGLVGIVFVHLGGQDGLNFILPFLMFVFLMALGSDYNILIMSRIREEAHTLPLRDAVARAIGRTGATITTAGVILAGTFAVLAIAGGSSGGGQIQQIGYGIAAGVLMDTFLLRALLVPSLVVLLGRWNWWPSQLAVDEAPAPHVPAAEPDAAAG